MNENGIHLVRVMTDDRKHQLWAAATARDEAVNRVLDKIPEGWAARLLDEPMRPREYAVLDLAFGQVCRLGKVPTAAQQT